MAGSEHARAHVPPPRPADDAARLAVLRGYEVLDTPGEQQYQDLVALAAAICGTPVAAMTLVDEDRQWFKATVGVDVAETPREVSFCAHAILQPDAVLEVPDATADDRFRANPLVTAPDGIRFYAGMPLVTVDEVPLGALCVIDRQPRRLSPDQRSALEVLGRQVVAQLELRRTLRNVARSEQRVRESEARYRYLSEHDALTGLANRSRFHDELGRLQGSRVGLLFLDLDGFKQVNDEHGHLAGDTVLVEVAAVLRTVVDAGALVARLGGDEFAVLLPGGDAAALRGLAARVVGAVGQPVEVAPGVHVVVGCSAGWAVSDGAQPPERLLRRADRRMYDAKAAGRRRVVAGTEPRRSVTPRALPAPRTAAALEPLGA